MSEEQKPTPVLRLKPRATPAASAPPDSAPPAPAPAPEATPPAPSASPTPEAPAVAPAADSAPKIRFKPRLSPAAEPAPAAGSTVQLSPFVVSTEGDEGYRAANTLSGTRMNASLFHTPAAISVLTKDFLDDIAAENVADMLKFAMSSDNERTDSGGGLAQAWDVRATIRGFTESVITRDYLPNMVQSRGILANDRFNVDRADVSRGPNSILYGASRPGGAFNLNSKRAVLNGRQKSAQ
ncbi:MAG: TonB-dependent receptor plug domain-containing protein, partial [Opitutaceae bacterium]